MRLAIASDDGDTVARHTGPCQGFVVFEVDGPHVARVEYRKKPLSEHMPAHEHADEHHRHSHLPLLQTFEDCSVLISRGMGPRLIADLSARGIDAFVCDAEDVDRAAMDFAAGRLARIEGGGCCQH